MILKILRSLRHGPLSSLRPMWNLAGTGYRKLVTALDMGPSGRSMVGSHGPFFFHPQYAFSDFSSWGGAHNDGFEECVQACHGKKCVFDIGAHVGLVSMPISKVIHSDGVVCAFEPAKRNNHLLRFHLKQNEIGNVEVFDLLVGQESADEVEFNEQSRDTGMNSLVIKHNPEKYHQTYKKQTSLDDFCQVGGYAPEILKIDVEGAEINVLRGAREVLAKFRPTIFLSVHPTEISLMGQSIDDLVELVDSMGYSIKNIDGSQLTEPMRLREYLVVPN